MKIGLSSKYLLICEIVALVITWNQVINGIIKYKIEDTNLFSYSK